MIGDVGGSAAASRLRSVCAPVARAGAIALILLGLASLSPHAAAAADDHDTFTAVSLPVAYGPVSGTVAEYDSSSFTLQEPGETERYCGEGEKVRSSDKSGWVRFVPGVAGQLTVTITTPTYFGMVETWGGQPGLTETFYNRGFRLCAWQEFPEQNQASITEAVQANVPINIETNGVRQFCGMFEGELIVGCTEEATVTGGPTAVALNFVPNDGDKDTVPDTIDQCPTQAGSPNLNGCPDSDGDGIRDSQDKCPSQAGPASVGGCPDPDGDGVPYPVDLCPTQKGPAIFGGCPDSDGDGVPDHLDQCPTAFASQSLSLVGDGRRGCPEPLKAALPYTFTATRHGMHLQTFTVEAPIGSGVTLTCAGHGCPRKVLKQLTTTRSVTRIVPVKFGRSRHAVGVWIPVGATVTAIVTHSGTLGIRRTLTPRPHGSPRRKDTCLDPSGKPVKCPV